MENYPHRHWQFHSDVTINFHIFTPENKIKLVCLEAPPKPESKIKNYTQTEPQCETTINSHLDCFENEIKLESLESSPNSESQIKIFSQIEPQRERTINSHIETKPVSLMSQSKPVSLHNRLLQPKSPQRKTRNVWTSALNRDYLHTRSWYHKSVIPHDTRKLTRQIQKRETTRTHNTNPKKIIKLEIWLKIESVITTHIEKKEDWTNAKNQAMQSLESRPLKATRPTDTHLSTETNKTRKNIVN